MLNRLTQFSLAQRVLVLVAATGVVIAGAIAFQQLPVDAYPEISPTQVKLILKAPGMTPEEVESRVVAPLETELLGVPREVMLRSIAKYALADITIDFEEGTDIYWARQQIAERFAGVADVLPGDVTGGLAPIATPLSDMFMFTIEGGELDLQERRTLLDWTIRPALRTIPGVADVNALGGSVRSFAVVPDRARLAAAGMHLRDVVDALERNNRNDGSGRLIDGEEALIVRAEGAVRNLDDLRAIVLGIHNGAAVRVGDVADVRVEGMTRYGAVTRDGVGEAVQGIVVSLRGADSGAVVDAVRARLQELQPSLPPGVHIDVFYDRSVLIDRAVGTITKALLEATVLVVILLLLFLGDVRSAVVVAVTLPFAVLLTFLLMRMFGLSANLMSLGGLAIALGMLVDASVVVVENVVARLTPDAEERSRPVIQRVLHAVAEVSTPVSAGILIICLVFLPLLTLEGLEGRLFVPVALTIVFALGGSLLLSLTVIPVLASLLLREREHREPWLMRMLDRGYRPLLAGALANPRRVFIAAGLSLLVGVGAWLAVGKSFMPTMDEGDLMLQLTKLPSISLQQSVDTDLAIEREILARVPEVEHIVARVGADELGLDPMGLNESDVFMQLKPKSQWRKRDKAWLAAQIREVTDGFPGVDVGFTQPIEMRISEMLTGSRGDVAVKVFGDDLRGIDRVATEIAAVLESLEGSEDVMLQAGEGVEYLKLQIDPLAAGRAGLSVSDVQDELRAQLEGMPAGVVIESGRRTPLLVRGTQAVRSDPERFAQLAIARGDGPGEVPLSLLADIQRSAGPVQVHRENGLRYALVQANVAGRDLVGFVDEARQQVASRVTLPPGYRVVWGGQFENQQRAAARLGLVIPVALGLILLVLYSTFGSLRQALLIIGNIPFALVGGLLALWASGQYMSVPASVGFIALLGIAVLNGLVLVTQFNQLQAAGLSALDQVREGALRRLRPVMMTAMITGFGLVPLLFATGPGSEIQRPLAIVVIGGLFSSTVLTLLLLPVLFLRYGARKPLQPSPQVGNPHGVTP